MKYEKTYIERLIRLAQHFASGRLYGRYIPMTPPDGLSESEPPVFQTEKGIVFAFFCYTDELTYLFHEHWTFDKRKRPILIKQPDLPLEDSAVGFLGITPQEFIHCFVPNGQKREVFGGEILPYHAVPQDLAHNIFELVGMHLRMN